MSRIFILLILLASAFQVQATEGQDYLDRFLEDLKTFQANFNQTLTNPRGDIVERTSGIFYMKNPGQFHWSYKDPYEQSIITNGGTLWIYDTDLEQVTIKDISTEIENSPAAILSGSDNLEEYFSITDKGKIEGIYNLELVPKDPENQFHKIVLGFYGRFLNMMVMFDKLGQITRITFTDSQRNESLDDTLFNFIAPEGTDIIDAREVLVEAEQ